MNHKTLKAIDFFCGAGGMSYGFSQAGIRVLGGIDHDADCKGTYEGNIENANYMQRDITGLSCEAVADFFGISPNDDQLVFCGCSPCQFWSKVQTDRTKSRRTAFLLQHFERFILHFRPGFVVVENVPGLLRNKRHTILPKFTEFLTHQGYSFKDGIVDANHYGVPQHRRRYLLIATRLLDQVTLPLPSKNSSLTVRYAIGKRAGLSSLAAGQGDRKDPLHRAAALSSKNLRRIKKTPDDGGDRSSWRGYRKLQLKAYDGHDDIFADVYGRMHWDRPAPTITTRFNSLSNGRFGHPKQHRAISLREGAILQSFPRKFRFLGSSNASIARQIGNAVPPRMARRIGFHLKRLTRHG
jgi:DNA (cytosine-5)-methyltransferase 1